MMSSFDNKGESDTRFDTQQDTMKLATSEETSKQAPERQDSANSRDVGDSSDAVFSDSLLKALRRKTSSLGGGSNGSGSGDNSDNSGSGLASFGFNFDTYDAIINPGSLGGGSDGSGGGGISPPSDEPQGSLSRKSSMDESRYTRSRRGAPAPVSESGAISSTTSGGKSSISSLTNASHDEAAAAAVANLHSIASSHSPEKSADQGRMNDDFSDDFLLTLRNLCSSPTNTTRAFSSFAVATTVTSSADVNMKPPARSTRKRPTSRNSGENDSGGYNSDGESAVCFDSQYNAVPPPSRGRTVNSSPTSSFSFSLMPIDSSNDDEARSTTSSKRSTTRPKKKKKLNESKREERNAREKERSYRISKQINELRSLLSKGGVAVPKGTKSSVLSEAANYIRMLQQHQYRSEM